MTKKKKIILIASLSFIGAQLLAVLIPFSIYGIRSSAINNSYTYLFNENKITNKKIEVPLVKQDISCGYAIIEMLSSYYGKTVTEKELYDKNNGAISTATTSGFVKEINQTLETTDYISKEYLKNDQLLIIINESLVKDKPVAIEWAAKFDNEWTLRLTNVMSIHYQI